MFPTRFGTILANRQSKPALPGFFSRCCAPTASRPGQSMDVSMFQGHYLDTVLQNEARRRNKRTPSRSFQATEDAADEAAAEERRLNRETVQGVAALAPRRVFVEDTLQGPPMHFEAPGGLGDIASALLKHPLDVFPAHPVCRHRILGWTGQWPLRFQ